MPDLYNTLQQIVENERKASVPMAICYGKVVSIEPFRVQLTQKLVLEKEFFIVKSGVSTASFKKGDTLILLRNEGGQNYLILDKKGAL